MFEYESSARECISVTGIFIVAGRAGGLKSQHSQNKE